MAVVFVLMLYTTQQQLELTIAHGFNIVSRFIGMRRPFQVSITVQIMPTIPLSSIDLSLQVNSQSTQPFDSQLHFHAFSPFTDLLFPRFSSLYRISSFPTFPTFSCTVSLSHISSLSFIFTLSTLSPFLHFLFSQASSLFSAFSHILAFPISLFEILPFPMFSFCTVSLCRISSFVLI